MTGGAAAGNMNAPARKGLEGLDPLTTPVGATPTVGDDDALWGTCTGTEGTTVVAGELVCEATTSLATPDVTGWPWGEMFVDELVFGVSFGAPECTLDVAGATDDSWLVFELLNGVVDEGTATLLVVGSLGAGDGCNTV